MSTATTQTPSSAPSARSLRVRWRGLMILGMNLLIAIIASAATLIVILEQQQAVTRLQKNAAAQIETTVRIRVADLQDTLALTSPSLSTTQAELNAVLADHPALRAVSLVDTDGNEILRAAAGEAYLDTAAEDGVILGVPGQDSVLIARVDSQVLWQDALTATIGDKGYGYLVNGVGRVLATGPAISTSDPARPAGFTVLDEARAGKSSLHLYRGLDKGWVVGRAAPVAGLDVYVLTEMPLSEFTPVVVRVVALWALALALTALAGEWLIRRILRSVLTPFDTLRSGARAVGEGDYGYRVRLPAGTDLELVDLGNAFNTMIERLQESQRQIDAYTHEMQEIVDLRARELSRKAFQLEVAADVSRKIATIRDPRALIAEVVKLIQARFEVYHVEIWLVDEKQGLILPGQDGHPVGPIRQRDDSTSVVAWVVRHGKTVYLPDVRHDPRYRRADMLPASQSELAIPLQSGEQVIGALNLEADHRDAFAKDEIAVLESLANEIAVSLHNARMFDALETANRELAQASLEAKQAHTLKSRFMLNASHKLRTPLNVIIGYSETITSGVYGDVPEKVLDRQRRILENGRVLQALIEDMLDLSSIETGHMELDFQWIDLAPLLDEVLNAARALHQTGFPNHDLTLRLEVQSHLPPIWADLDRLRYIIINLMSNAVKFTQSGEVVLAAAADAERLYVHVRDTGPGISDDEQRVLFEPFQHQHGSTASSGKGTGLGLTVSRMLALKHGGDLAVQSTPGRGSTFTLSLPRRPAGAPPPPTTGA
jgi:signal transduction histidine kinase